MESVQKMHMYVLGATQKFLSGRVVFPQIRRPGVLGIKKIHVLEGSLMYWTQCNCTLGKGWWWLLQMLQDVSIFVDLTSNKNKFQEKQHQ